MYRMGISIVAVALLAVGAAAQPQAGAQTNGQASVEAGKTQAPAGASGSTSAAITAQNGQTNAALAGGTAFNAELTSSVDTKKCKPGDAVNAKTTEAVKSEGKTVIPKGSKLVGHVTQASARAKGEAESSVGIVFDKAILKNGEEIPLSVAIQALASGQSSASMAGSDMDALGSMGTSAAGSGTAGGRGGQGGVTSAAGTVTNTAANVGRATGGAVNSTSNAAGSVAGTSKGAAGGSNSTGQLTSNSQGVFGLNGLNLNAAASNATQGTVITSAGKNVHLESGTRMLLVTQAQASSADESKNSAERKPNPKSGEKPEKP